MNRFEQLTDKELLQLVDLLGKYYGSWAFLTQVFGELLIETWRRKLLSVSTLDAYSRRRSTYESLGVDRP